MSIYDEDKVVIDRDQLALTPGLDSQWRNILLAGSDTRVAGRYGRTDAMVIISVNAAARLVKLTSVMRDIWTPMYGRGPQKLCAAAVFGGPALTMRTINEDFGMNIEDYVLIDMTGIESIIDMLGGVEIDLTQMEVYGLNNSWNSDGSALIEPVAAAGENVHLTGEQALAYARLRSIDNDYQRVARQRSMLLAIAHKAASASASDLLMLVREGMKCIDTSLTMTDVIQLAALAVQIDLEGVEQFRIPVEGSFSTDTISVSGASLWVINPDFEKNAALLREFIYGAAD